MGMFDSLRDENDNEWQTKAFDSLLHTYKIGDRVWEQRPADFQFEIFGGGPPGGYTELNRESLATVRDGVLVSIDDDRDPSLTLIDYTGRLAETPVAPVASSAAAPPVSPADDDADGSHDCSHDDNGDK